MNQRVCVVTGGSRGIGRATALGLAELGARVLLVASDPRHLEQAKDQISSVTGAPVEAYPADLSRISDVKALAAKILSRHPRIDVLVNNHTRIYPERQITEDRLEANFALNYLSYYVLSRLLLGAFSRGGRIVNVAAEAHKAAHIDFDDLQFERNYDAVEAYNRAKLAILLLSFELARRVPASRITVNCLHPGIVDTDARRAYRAAAAVSGARLILSGREPVDARAGAQCSLYLATAEEVGNLSGKYFVDCREREPSKDAQDPEAARRLWSISASLSGLDVSTQPM